jgi:spore germination cell wall hydrolase CwlJ-like protein
MKRFFVPYAFSALSVITIASWLYPVSCAHAADQQTDISAVNPLVHPATTSASGSQTVDAGATGWVQTTTPAPDVSPDVRQVECMAKVIVHEAGNQVRRGQVAVAQVIRTRMKKYGAGDNVCQIVRQPGQFFNVDLYTPSRETATWTNAVAIATETLRGEGEDIVPGALFFRAAGHPMKGRARVAQIDNHVFYR